MTEENKGKTGEISRREFLRDAGLLVGGTAIGTTMLLSACGGEDKTITETVTKTSTQAVTKYVCPIDGLEFNSLADLQAHFASAHGGEVPVSSAVSAISLTVNGLKREILATPTDTLRDVLRNQLGLTSIKDMCSGYGACGSCSVIMDGRPVLSCLILAIECGGRSIETAEGIAKSRPDLIEAYAMNHCMQCGYCTPGFVVTTKALLDHNPNPTVDEFRQAISGNLCRCGTYPMHIRAVQALS